MNKEYIASNEKMEAFRTAMPWIAAIDSWDYCDESLLADLILNSDIPQELRPIISSIIKNERKQNKRAAAHLKIPAKERMAIAQSLSIILGLIDDFKSATVISGESLLEWQGNRKGQEPIEVKRELESEAKNIIISTAEELGVSTETIENLLRDFRKKMASYPLV